VADIEPVLGFIQMQSHYAQEHGWKIRLTQLYIIHALAWHALDEQDQAHTMLVKALHLADTYDGVGVFLEFKQSLQSLLAHAASSYPIRDDFFQKIMALVIRPIQPRPENPVSPDELSEPLTEREQDVLRLMAAGLSNPEIAQELYLGLNTIKTHTRGIYGKLGVSNRTQATVRARELGLV
jgi:LuxR family maltose regulon positive regulatory protein